MLEVSRKELKYLLTSKAVYGLKEKLAAVMDTDFHSGQDGYLVRSLYFDSIFDTDFEDKVSGYDRRQKIRLRVYHPRDETVKLELKEKLGMAQRKRSLILNRQEAEGMIKGDYAFLMERPEETAHKLYTYMMTHCYRPKCIVEYDRLAYCRKENDMRVTFDCNLRATESNVNLFDEELMLYPVASPDEVTMEVKYNGFLYSYVKNVISKTDGMQISNSKYCRARRISKRG